MFLFVSLRSKLFKIFKVIIYTFKLKIYISKHRKARLKKIYINVLEAIRFIKTFICLGKGSTGNHKICFQKAGFDKNRSLISEFEPEEDLPLATFALLKTLGEPSQMTLSQ